MPSQPEISKELPPEIFLSLSPEKASIVNSAQPSLFALLENDEFHQGPKEKLLRARCGLVFETLAREEFHSLHHTPKLLRRLEELIITSMKSDIGILRPPAPPGESYHRPDILVMEYEKSSQVVTITQIGEIKLGLLRGAAERLGKILEQHDRLIGDLKKYLGEIDLQSSNLESLTGLSVKEIELLTEEKGRELFYILPYRAAVLRSMKDWKIYHSDFSRQEIEKITQALLDNPRFKNV